MTTTAPLPQRASDRLQTKYERLCEQLVDDLHAGRLKPGDLLPSELEFAAHWKVARSTVRQALAQLERRGLVRRIRGKGTFIHEDATTRAPAGLDAIALIVPDPHMAYYPSLVAGFEDAARHDQKQVLLVSTQNDVHRQGDGILQLINKQVAGVAIVPSGLQPTPAYQVRELQRNKIPVVLCHRAVEGAQAPIVAFASLEVGRMAGAEVARRGHRSVAFVSPRRSPLAANYERGFREAMEAAGASLPPNRCIFLGSEHYADGEAYERVVERAVLDLVNRKDRPTAIFTGFDATTELIFLILLRHGLSVPEDISLISFGGAARLSPMQQRMTAVTVDGGAIGRIAVNLIHDMRRGELPIDSGKRVEIPLGLSAGQTLKKV